MQLLVVYLVVTVTVNRRPSTYIHLHSGKLYNLNRLETPPFPHGDLLILLAFFCKLILILCSPGIHSTNWRISIIFWWTCYLFELKRNESVKLAIPSLQFFELAILQSRFPVASVACGCRRSYWVAHGRKPKQKVYWVKQATKCAPASSVKTPLIRVTTPVTHLQRYS